MEIVTNKPDVQLKRTNPQKFLIWIAMASIIMAFAGLTSAYLLKRSHTNWLEFSLPSVFWVSTVVILISSVSMYLALQAFRKVERKKYRVLITVTAMLGIVFCVLQFVGFQNVIARGINIFGNGSNPSASFLGVIFGFHILHVLGGVIALLVFALKSYNSKIKSYNAVPVEIVSTYWHFVGVLWIYLWIFFNLV